MSDSDSTASRSIPERLRPLAAVAAAALVYYAPGHLDAERWGLYEPIWARAEPALLAAWAALAAWCAARRRLGPAALLALAAPAVALKLPATDLRDLPAHLAYLLCAVPVALLAAGAAWRGLLGAWLAALALAVPVALRWGELASQEAILLTGEVERRCRTLAEAVGDDSVTHGPPPADPAEWLARLGLDGWVAAGHTICWVPAEGVAPTVLRLDYAPPATGATGASTILSGQTPRLVRPGSRPFRVRIGADGRVTWSWPAGPPAAVAARRQAAE